MSDEAFAEYISQYSLTDEQKEALIQDAGLRSSAHLPCAAQMIEL